MIKRWIVALALLPVVWLTAAYAEEPASAKIAEELSKQQSIYLTGGDQTIEGYTVNRPLAHYVIDADTTIQAFVVEAIREKLTREGAR